MKRKYDLGLFSKLYYEDRLGYKVCAERMGVHRRNLWNFVKRHGLTLRTNSEGVRLAYKTGRKITKHKIHIDWNEFEELYYGKNMTYTEIALVFNISPQALQERAVSEGYKSRRAVCRV